MDLGIAADYLRNPPRGKHHFLNEPLGLDATWDHGVRVWSDQIWLTAFLRLRC